MRFSRNFWIGSAPIAAGLLLGGCNSADVPSAPTPMAAATTDIHGSSDFDRDLIAAKHSSLDPAKRNEAIVSVLTHYGITPALTSDEAPSLPEIEAAPKAAASTFLRVMRNFSASNDIHCAMRTVNVPAFGSLSATAIGEAAGVDPVLVAFYRNDASSNTEAFQIKVAAFNDDISSSNRNSQIAWTNTGFTNKTVTLVAFSYSDATRGSATLGIMVNGALSVYKSQPLTGKVKFGTDALSIVPAGCAPVATSVVETPLSGGGFMAAALVVDTQAMKGGFIWDDPFRGAQALAFAPVLAAASPSFALLFEAWPNNNPGNVEEGSSYGFLQRDVYNCPF